MDISLGLVWLELDYTDSGMDMGLERPVFGIGSDIDTLFSWFWIDNWLVAGRWLDTRLMYE
jgi:hypothetical protein